MIPKKEMDGLKKLQQNKKILKQFKNGLIYTNPKKRKKKKNLKEEKVPSKKKPSK